MNKHKYWVEIHTLNESSGIMHTQTGQTFSTVIECNDSYTGEQMLKSQYSGYNKEVRVSYQGQA
jgi:hypothetical protein